jgi:Domain of Unknown Function (DUF1080)
MKSAVLVLNIMLAAGVLLAADLAQPSSANQAWKPLFNGKDLTGWRPYGKRAIPGAGWKVEDGILKKIQGMRGGDIITDEKFDNFELSWEWRISPAGNNGVKYFVTEERPSAPGPEYQMIDDATNPDGKNGPTHQTASFYDVLPPSPEKDKVLKAAGDWNTSRIVVRGNRVEHWLNGAQVLAYETGSDAVKQGIARSKFKNAPGFGDKIKGHILLTDHKDECWFRNIRIRELN